jgi:hypothetical protein
MKMTSMTSLPCMIDACSELTRPDFSTNFRNGSQTIQVHSHPIQHGHMILYLKEDKLFYELVLFEKLFNIPVTILFVSYK